MSDDPRKHSADAAPTPGRVTVDSRGNSVWQWSEDVTGDTSVLLRSLDNDSLALAGTGTAPVVTAAEVEVAPAGQGESTSVVLKRLENEALAIEPTWTVPIPEGLGQRSPRGTHRSTRGELDIDGALVDEGGGFNPYNRS